MLCGLAANHNLANGIMSNSIKTETFFVIMCHVFAILTELQDSMTKLRTSSTQIRARVHLALAQQRVVLLKNIKEWSILKILEHNISTLATIGLQTMFGLCFQQMSRHTIKQHPSLETKNILVEIDILHSSLTIQAEQ